VVVLSWYTINNCTVWSGLLHCGKTMRKHTEDSRLQEHGLASIAAMALRSPDNALKVVALGGIPTMLKSMQMFPTNTSLQRQVKE